MAASIELLRALVLLSSLTICLVVLVLIGGLTIEPPAADTESFACGTKTNIDKDGMPFSDSQIRGKALFKQNCATCHNRNMVDDMTGPALAGVSQRWSAYNPEDLYQWIRNSESMVEAKHPRALAICKDWNRRTMTSFPNLSDEEIGDILAFVEGVEPSI